MENKIKKKLLDYATIIYPPINSAESNFRYISCTVQREIKIHRT